MGHKEKSVCWRVLNQRTSHKNKFLGSGQVLIPVLGYYLSARTRDADQCNVATIICLIRKPVGLYMSALSPLILCLKAIIGRFFFSLTAVETIPNHYLFSVNIFSHYRAPVICLGSGLPVRKKRL